MNSNNFFGFGSNNFIKTTKKEIYESIYLQAIIDSYDNIDKTVGLENEIKDRFVWDLQNNNPLTSKLFNDGILDIIPERYNMVSQTEKSRADICFHWSDFGWFEIECKRLFQQPSKNEAYLNDGLIRFINLKYSKNNDYAGMIGFVVSGEISTIKDKILNEVSIFYPNNALTRDSKLNWKYSFISHHKKISNDRVQIYHLFFQFTDNE